MFFRKLFYLGMGGGIHLAQMSDLCEGFLDPQYRTSGADLVLGKTSVPGLF